MISKKITIASLITLLVLSACATQDSSSTNVSYNTSNKKSTPLEIPPGLSDYEKNKQFNLDDGVSALSYHHADGSNKSPVLIEAKDMHIEKAGDARWLVVKRPAEVVWPVLQDFWEENGFSIRSSSDKLGIMETDWAENRAALPKTGLRGLIGKAIESVYESSMRDMFKTRIERTSDGVEIYISHRGMEEVYTSSSKDSTVWQARAVDTQLETEFLRRLMLKLGVNEESAQTKIKNSVHSDKGSTISDNTLVVNDSMENTWRRVGLSLDRVGLSVTDRNYTTRVYYVQPNPDDRGMFKKVFGKLNETFLVQFKELSPNKIQVSFASENDTEIPASSLTKVLKDLQKALQ